MIIRASRKFRFTAIPNDLIEDSSIDWRDLGLIVYLLSKPDSWEISTTHLMKERKTGRDGIYAILKALVSAGYASRKPSPDGGWDWIIFDTKQKPNTEKPNTEKPNTEKPNTEKPDPEKPNTENPTQVNTEYKVNTEVIVNTEKTLSNPLSEAHKDEVKAQEPKPSKSEIISEIFEFWKSVMNHPMAKLDDKRKKHIADALKLDYSKEQLKSAIIGCSFTPHNMGENSNSQRYDGIHIIFKSSENIERFIDNSISLQKPKNQSNRAGYNSGFAKNNDHRGDYVTSKQIKPNPEFAKKYQLIGPADNERRRADVASG